MLVLKALIICAAWLTVHCQGPQGPTTTPVPILKQINRQNDDGSYSYGYEAADGSFKIETKYPNGDVAGKYGYVDENGKSREISYGASSQRGFEPEGPGIQVPPPTLNHSPSNALTDGQEDDGQYREDPSIYEDPKYNSKNRPRPSTFRQFHQPAPAPTAAPVEPAQYQQFRSSPVYSQQTNLYSQAPQQFPQQQNQQFSQPQQFSQGQNFRPQNQVYHQQPQFSYQASFSQPGFQNFQSSNLPQYQQNYQAQNYQQQNYNPFGGHPAQNFNPNTGSYTIDFTG